MPVKKIVLLVLTLTFISIISFQAYEYYEKIQAETKRAEALKKFKQARDPVNAKSLTDFRKRFFVSHKTKKWETLPKEQTASVWYQKEKRLYNDISEGKTFDTLVLPIQEQRTSVDLVTRIMSARFIADEIRSRTSQNVMPVELAQRLLGERSYNYSDTDISTLTKQYNIKNIIYLYYKKNHKRSTTKPELIKEYNLAVINDSIGKNFEVNIFNLTTPNNAAILEISVKEKTPAIISQLFKNAVKNTETKDIVSLSPPELPSTIVELTNSNSSPLQQAINLQLLGMLVPKNNIYERKRFFERSLIALNSVHKDSTYYNFLKARAYFYLYRRPLAINLLGKPGTPEEKALFAYINGNHTDLKSLYNTIDSPLFKLFAFVELSNLSEQYSIYDKLPLPIGNANKWLEFATSRSKDIDGWYTPNNTQFFRNLDGAFPEFDVIYTQIIKNKAAIGNLNEFGDKLDTIFETTFHKYITNNKSSLCCNLGLGKVSKFDIALLYRTVGISNLQRKLNKLVNIQIRTTASLDLYRSYEILFDGHPTFLRLKAEALSKKLKRTPDSEKTALIKEIFEKADLAFTLTSGSDKNSYRAFNLAKEYSPKYTKIFNPQAKSKYYSKYIADFPSSASISNCEISICLDYTQIKFRLFKDVYSAAKESPTKSYGNKTVAQLLVELETRFNGHPRKIPFHANILTQQGKDKAARKLLATATDNKSNNWKIYEQLGELFLLDGKYDKAEETFLKYPEFSNKNSDEKVLLSNLSYDAGSTLFWGGAAEQSRKLYKYSADLKTGSGASLTSAQRLAILDKDFLAATNISLYTANRYNNIYRYRDYLGMLHVYGLHERADAGFIELAPRFSTPQLWSSHFIGQRIQKKNTNDILSWLHDYKKSANEQLIPQIDRYALNQIITDRKIDTKKTLKIKELISLNEKKNSYIKVMAPRSELITYLNTDLEIKIKDPLLAMRENPPPAFDFTTAEKAIIPNRNILFIKAYTHLKNGNNLKAYELFREHAMYNFGNLYKDMNTQVLPYIALTVKDVNKLKQFERYLTEKYRTKHYDTFDYYLANAVILTVKGDINGALKILDKTLALRPHTNSRIISTMYQMLDISELLYHKTKDARFITKAIKWAKYYQTIQPQVSWVYAFEAKYSKNSKDKIKATAYTLYLDPQSEWLKAVPKKYHAKAKKWWKKYNPFILPKTNTTKNKKTKA